MLKLFITKEFIFEPEEVAVYLILNGLQNNKNDILFTSIDEIGYYLTGRFLDSQKDRRIINGIKKGLSTLIKDENIKFIEQDKNNYIFDGTTCRLNDKANFTIIELWEIQKIFALGAIGFKLLKYYMNIVGTINGKTKSWHMSQEDMCEAWEINYVTLNEYNKKLEELELLFIYRGNARKKDGTFHKINNVYGRYRDKDEIMSEARIYLSSTEFEYYMEKNKLDGDTRTSIKMRYNGFVAGAKKYKNNQGEILKLYDDCVRYNKTLDERYTELTPLDLSVFDSVTNLVNQKQNIESNDLDSDSWGDANVMAKDTFDIDDELKNIFGITDSFEKAI
ncbi:hypothetical protein CLNEO_13660 [Anaerotignum neopropionicum]|uniref:Uncharacterized protein n=1 Tax=Anaerotignum neopropionicum TaxID=36847 RepID=A0A136WFW1_9FIRM|nr:hypothetical protein [Anaerotignum neopropionicum]KXL53395.1 hypothetical protein CLNEO_13660 [Anaerotignum neopropionicum]